MESHFEVVGSGYAVGSQIVDNRDTSVTLGLPPVWLEERTGIRMRRVCAPGEDVVSLAVSAVGAALGRAGLRAGELGPETRLFYIQNGCTHLTPPAVILLSNELGMPCVRPVGLDGVCAEPIVALELAAALFSRGNCERAIIASSVDFLSVVSGTDPETAGLFGAGAGALILDRADGTRECGLQALAWETDSSHWDLGIIPLRGYERREKSVLAEFGYYQMQGRKLARKTLVTLPRVLRAVLQDAGWQLDQVDLFVTHQPNARMLEAGARQLGISQDRLVMTGKVLGNMGPASLLVALAMALEDGRIRPGARVLLIAFGLGLSCGVAALRF